MLYKYVKRILDVVGALMLLVILSPVMFIIIIITYFDQPQVFFKQLRIGKSEKPFAILKFHTIIYKNEGPVITPFADFLRSHSLDELPQLINVIKGEMSLVGPRPFFPDYLSYYTEEEKKRHQVKPGITGLAQVTGGNRISWQQKLQLDLLYVKSISLKLDMEILFKSFGYVFKKSNHWDVVPLTIEREIKMQNLESAE